MPPNFMDILSHCKNIIRNDSRHFTILFLIFLLPLSFSFQLFLFPQIQETTNPFFYVLYFLFVLVFYTCALSSITFSVYHRFCGKQVKLLSTLYSIFSSFLPLFATLLLSFPFYFSLELLYILGFEMIDVTCLHCFIVVLPLVLYLKVNWTLAPVIVVMESCWGLEPLRKSEKLMKGMKREALSYLLIFGFWVCLCTRLTRGIYGITHGGWGNYLIIGSSSCLFATFVLNYIAFCAVLYIYCKVEHGELVEQFGEDCVRFSHPSGCTCNNRKRRRHKI